MCGGINVNVIPKLKHPTLSCWPVIAKACKVISGNKPNFILTEWIHISVVHSSIDGLSSKKT